MLNQKFVQGRGGLVKVEHFDKHFVKNTRKKSLSGKNLEFLSYILLNHISNEKLNSKMDTIRPFFSLKSGHFCRISKKGRGVLLVARLSLAITNVNNQRKKQQK